MKPCRSIANRGETIPRGEDLAASQPNMNQSSLLTSIWQDQTIMLPATEQDRPHRDTSSHTISGNDARMLKRNSLVSEFDDKQLYGSSTTPQFLLNDSTRRTSLLANYPDIPISGHLVAKNYPIVRHRLVRPVPLSEQDRRHASSSNTPRFQTSKLFSITIQKSPKIHNVQLNYSYSQREHRSQGSYHLTPK